MIQYSLTNDTVTVFIKGEPHSVTKGTPNYAKLREAVIREDWDAIPGLLTVEKAVESWLQGAPTAKPTVEVRIGDSEADFTVTDGRVCFKGEALPTALNDRIIKMAGKDENPLGLMNFWRRLKRNPNPHSVQQLFGFLQHTGIPIQEDGTFLAYKGVNPNFRDCYSGQFDNSPGKTIKMDRSKVSPDPSTACHRGLHVGAIGYARSFGRTTIIVRVDPANVVCVPNDHEQQKMRTCEYTVVGLYGTQMPDTSFQADAAVKYEAPATLDAETQADGDDGYEVMVDKPTLPIRGTMWDDFNGMDRDSLLNQSLSDLRKYALYNCQITGASKLPGGKDALVARIIEVCTPPEPEPVIEETAPTPATEPGMKLPLTGTEWDRLNGLNTLELLQESSDTLRKYATHNCLIIGASKMGGGKVALIARIAEIRGDEGIK